MSIEALISILALLGITVVYLISKSSEKKRQGFSQVRSFLDKQMKEIFTRIESKKNDLDKSVLNMETILNRANAISRIVEDNIKTSEQRMLELNQSEQAIGQIQEKTVEMEQFLSQMMVKINSIKKEEQLVDKLKKNIELIDLKYSNIYQEVDKTHEQISKNIAEKQAKIEKMLEHKYSQIDKEIHDKNAYLEKISTEKLTQIDAFLKKYLAGVEVQTGNFLNGLEKENKSRVSLITDQAQEALGEWIKTNTDVVDRMIKDMKENEISIKNFKNQFMEDIDHNFTDKMQEIDDFIAKTGKSFQIYESNVHEMLENQEAIFQENFQKMTGNFSQNYKEFRNELGTLKESYKQEIEEMKEETETTKKNFYQYIEQESKTFDKKINTFEVMISRIDEIAAEQEYRIKRNIELKTSGIEENLNQELSTIYDKVQKAESNIKDILDKFSTKVSYEMELSFKDIDKHKNLLETDYRLLENKLSSMNDNIDTTVNVKIREMGKVYEESQSEFENKIHQIQNDLQGRFKRMQDAFKEELDEFKNNIEYQKDALNNEKKHLIQEFKQSVDTHLDSSKEKLDQIQEKLLKTEENQKKLEERTGLFFERKNEDTDNFFHDQRLKFANKIKDLEAMQYANESKIQNYFDSKNEAVDSFLDTQKQSIEKQLKEILLSQENMTGNLKERVNNMLRELENNSRKQELMLNEKLSQLSGITDQRMKDIDQLLEAKSREINTFISKYKDSFETEFEGSATNIKRFVEDFYQNGEKMLLNIKNNTENQKDMITKDMKDHLKSVQEYRLRVEKEIENEIVPKQNEFFIEHLDTLKKKAENQMSLLESQMNLNLDELKGNMNMLFEKYDQQLSNLVDQNTDSIEEHQRSARQTVDNLIKEEKLKIDDVSKSLNDIRFGLDSELRKQKSLIQTTFDEMSEKVRSFSDNIETQFSDKEKKLNEKLSSKTDVLSHQLEELESRLSRIDTVFFDEISKTSMNVKEDLEKMQMEFDEKTKNIINRVQDEVKSLENSLYSTHTKLSETRKNLVQDMQEKMKSLEIDFRNTFNTFDKDLNAKRQNIESLYSSKTSEMRLIVDSIRHDVDEVTQIVGQYKNDKKINRVLQELSDMDNTFKRLEKQKESIVEVEKVYQGVKRDFDSMFSEIGKFDAKKTEIDNLNTRINQVIIRAKEADERIEMFNKKSAEMAHIESRINGLHRLYDQLQEKTRLIEAKEEKLSEMIQTIENNNISVREVKNQIVGFKNEVEKGFQKTDIIQERIQQLSLQLENVKDGEDKIDAILSRFNEVEGLSEDIQSRLKQLAGANDRLDLAEARIRNLLGLLDEPKTIDKATRKQGLFGNKKLSVTGDEKETVSLQQNGVISQAKKEAVFKYKSNGFTEDVIANILEITTQEVLSILQEKK